jgi:putative ABC transport system ATP-binding protein
MAGEPKLVIADEPTANLDSDTAARILDLLGELNTKTGVTFVFSTHDPALIARVPRVIRLHDGQIDGMHPHLAKTEPSVLHAYA